MVRTCTFFCTSDARGSVRKARPSQDIRSLSEFRANVATFVEQVQTTQRPLVLTQHGQKVRPFCSLLRAYEALIERAELAEDVRTAEAQGSGRAGCLLIARRLRPSTPAWPAGRVRGDEAPDSPGGRWRLLCALSGRRWPWSALKRSRV